MRSRNVLASSVAAVVLASCASIERDEVAAPAEGGKVTMRAGAPLVVSLPPDPSAGYGWVLRSASPNLALIGGPDYTPEPLPPGLVGVANTTAYRFRAMVAGEGKLEFAWVSPPGQPPAPERIVRYDVQIDRNIWLPTDLLGTVGMESVRGGPYAPPSDAPPVTTVNTTPTPTPAGAGAPGAVKYWSY